jgi:sulfatase modifying factor 1
MEFYRLMLLPAFVVVVCICGCGDDSADVSNGSAIGGSSGNAGGGRSLAPAAPQGRQVEKSKPAAEKPAPKVDAALAGADPKNVFALANNEGNFAIVDDGANTFLATVPEEGVDSSQFTAAPPGGGGTKSSSTRPNSKAPLPEGFVAVPEAGFSEDGFPMRIRCEEDGSLMVLIPSSISQQGTNDGPAHATPQIAVFLEAYYIDVAEVTLGQYGKFREWWREEKNRTLPKPINDSSPDDHPVLGVSWANARNYTTWVKKQLPTEPEWEKAARGPNGFLHPWGNGRAGWSPARTSNQIDAVMSFRADISPYGVYDLAGNAREWCADMYSATTYQEATRNGETVVRKWAGPKRAVVANHRVVKGNGPDWMAWNRSSVSMRAPGANVGFRCVLRDF